MDPAAVEEQLRIAQEVAAAREQEDDDAEDEDDEDYEPYDVRKEFEQCVWTEGSLAGASLAVYILFCAVVVNARKIQLSSSIDNWICMLLECLLNAGTMTSCCRTTSQSFLRCVLSACRILLAATRGETNVLVYLHVRQGWEAKVSKSTGATYYYCEATDESTWELPTEAGEGPEELEQEDDDEPHQESVQMDAETAVRQLQHPTQLAVCC